MYTLIFVVDDRKDGRDEGDPTGAPPRIALSVPTEHTAGLLARVHAALIPGKLPNDDPIAPFVMLSAQ